MSTKLSPSLKALINAPLARPGQTPAPPRIKELYQQIAREARERQYGVRPWLALSVRPPPRPPPTQKVNHLPPHPFQAAATFTLNSPASLPSLLQTASTSPSPLTPLEAAEFIREVGLKCISFNGIPRTINSLAAFRAALDPALVAQLETRPSRALTPSNLPAAQARGRALWESVYRPLDEKLEARLAESHPDLPVYILGNHYGPLLSDPPAGERGGLGTVGRTLTSVVAVACLRAQTGVGPQVLSHVFGLRKGVEQGVHGEEFEGMEGEGAGMERVAGDEGCEWLLESVDRIAEAIGGGFAGQWRGRESKL